MRHFRLTNGPSGFALGCTPEGLTLAGAPLLDRTELGFVPRPDREIDALLAASFPNGEAPPRLRRSLNIVADALNRGDLARAQIAAVLTSTPELDPTAAARVAETASRLAKYREDQTRDWHGRWSNDGGAAAPTAAIEAPKPVRVAQNIPTNGPRVVSDVSPSPTIPPTPDIVVAAPPAKPAAGANPTAVASDALLAEFERRYDDLHPVDFAKAIIQFGYKLETRGKDLPPEARENALAEYSFLQDRLGFWLAYEYTPPEAEGNLRSAAIALYRGATLAGLASPSKMPYSMLVVGGEAALFNNAPPPRLLIPVEDPPNPRFRVPGETPREPEGLGGTVDNVDAKIQWGQGSKAQGDPFEAFVGKQNPEWRPLNPTSKTFDLFDESTGEAISVKTLNTLSVSYIQNPDRIFYQMKRYVDASSNYEPYRDATDLRADQIKSRSVYIALPEYTSPTQWRFVNGAISYGSIHRISVFVTRIRD